MKLSKVAEDKKHKKKDKKMKKKTEEIDNGSFIKKIKKGNKEAK
jgi:hypothetical protein